MTCENNSVKAGPLSGRSVEMFQALRTNIPGGVENGFVGDVVVFRLDKDTADCLAAIAAESDATMYMTLLTIYNIILSIYTEKDKIVVGCPIAYTNTTIVPELTNYPGGEKHFSNPPGENGFLEEVKECVLKTFADNNIKESPVGARKAPAIFSLQNENNPQIELNDFQLALTGVEGDDGLLLGFQYNRRLFKKETIEGIAKHFTSIALQVVENPSIKICYFELQNEGEQKEIAPHGSEITPPEITVSKPIAEPLKNDTRELPTDELPTKMPESELQETPVDETKTQQEYYPLSFAQKQVWETYKAAPDRIAGNLTGNIIIREPLEQEILKQVLYTLVERHEILRSRFLTIEGEVVQAVEPEGGIDLNIIDIRALGPGEQEKRITAIYDLVSEKPFKLESGPLLRVRPVILKDDLCAVFFALHRMTADERSIEILTAELSTLYSRFREGKPAGYQPLPLQYKDFALWQKELFADPGKMAAALAFWRERLSGAEPLMKIPGDYLPAESPASESAGPAASAGYRFVIPSDVIIKLHEIASRCQAGLFMLLLAAYSLFLSRVTRSDDVLLGMAATGREHAHLHDIIGVFIKRLVIRESVIPGETFQVLLNRVRDNSLKALAFQDYPVEMLKRELGAGSQNIKVFVDMLRVDNHKLTEITDSSSYHIHQMPDSVYALQCTFTRHTNGLEVLCGFQTNRFKPGRIEYLMAEYANLLKLIANDPGKPVNSYEIFIPKKEKRKEENVPERMK